MKSRILFSLRTTWSTLLAFPNGFKKIYAETKEVINILRSKNVNERNRREVEQVRFNFETVNKIGLFFIVQLTPIIGTLPILIALRYPKEILTEHFWSDEQKQKFSVSDHKFRKEYSMILFSYEMKLKDSELNSIEANKSIKGKTVTDLPSKHVYLLAGANNVCNRFFTFRVIPNFFLRRWLRTYAKEIIEDDLMLQNEINTDLTFIELKRIIARRGFNPDYSEEMMNKVLKNWLLEENIQFYRMKYIKNQENDKKKQKEKEIAISMILHFIARNSLDTTKYLASSVINV